MIGLYDVKPAFVARLTRLADLAVERGVSADRITAGALLASAAGGAAIVAGGLGHPAWWLLVAPAGLARLVGNALDGAVARRTGSSHPRGAAANELADRASDLLLLVPTALIVPTWLTLIAVIGALGTSFVAVVALGLTADRPQIGPMGKADRVLVLAVAATSAVAFGPPAFTAGLAVVAAGTVVTMWLRCRHLFARLAQPAAR